MIAIINYNAGNIQSIANALSRLGFDSTITDDPGEIIKADKVIFPGVGEAGSAMNYLKSKNLDQLIVSLKQPTLGICLGLQLMCKRSEESQTPGLGIFDAVVRKFPPKDKIPHMGWNNFEYTAGKLMSNIDKESNTYYVHSYYAEQCPQTKSICDYIIPFSASMEKGNFYATQFHPEKSGTIGDKILLNFLEI